MQEEYYYTYSKYTNNYADSCNTILSRILLCFPFFIILLLVIKFFPEQINSKIILFLLLNMYIFPIITYGNPRYLTYYDNFLFLVFGEILFLYFTYANFLISNLKFISK